MRVDDLIFLPVFDPPSSVEEHHAKAGIILTSASLIYWILNADPGTQNKKSKEKKKIRWSTGFQTQQTDGVVSHTASVLQ